MLFIIARFFVLFFVDISGIDQGAMGPAGGELCTSRVSVKGSSRGGIRTPSRGRVFQAEVLVWGQHNPACCWLHNDLLELRLLLPLLQPCLKVHTRSSGLYSSDLETASRGTNHARAMEQGHIECSSPFIGLIFVDDHPC